MVCEWGTTTGDCYGIYKVWMAHCLNIEIKEKLQFLKLKKKKAVTTTFKKKQA